MPNRTACIHLKLSYHKVWKIWVISKLPDRPMSVNWCFILFASVFKFFLRFSKIRAHTASPKFCSFLVELADSLPGTQRSPYPTRRRKGSLTKLLPLSFLPHLLKHLLTHPMTNCGFNPSSYHLHAIFFALREILFSFRIILKCQIFNSTFAASFKC